ncbi:MAG TPA: PEP-CTERM sorting domain-containing protein, partial [Planctomycetota bacterium]|nr:PEP-CTERM sorting domain-containing protein [Planctomycetota bacterium]
TSADLMQIVWRNGMVGLDLGSTYCDHSSSVGDIEWDPVSNSLFFNNSWGQLYILALSDNGFLATDYVKGPGAVAPNPKVTSTSGFELDMNPLVVPEPTTLLLVGTGLLAGLRGLRHRRRK